MGVRVPSESRYSEKISRWRELLINKLKGRPEGFTDGKKLIPGRDYPPVLPHGQNQGHNRLK